MSHSSDNKPSARSEAILARVDAGTRRASDIRWLLERDAVLRRLEDVAGHEGLWLVSEWQRLRVVVDVLDATNEALGRMALQAIDDYQQLRRAVYEAPAFRWEERNYFIR